MRVLIADDDCDIAASLAMLVRWWGYEPVIATTGSAAIQILGAADGPALAVLDYAMPGMTGLDVCLELRKDGTRPYTYCLLVTGRGGRQEMCESLEAGADDYLVKPVDPDELRARLRTGKRWLEL
jgi:DNA-binding response OmpR family regulator